MITVIKLQNQGNKNNLSQRIVTTNKHKLCRFAKTKKFGNVSSREKKINIDFEKLLISLKNGAKLSKKLFFKIKNFIKKIDNINETHNQIMNNFLKNKKALK
jgi:ribosomal protein S16